MTELKDLSPEQQSVVETWDQGMSVLAGAGSGKTTTLVIKCAELLKRKPDARFAAVSFTERSASDLKTKLSQRLSLNGEGGALSGHWVMTIHGLCGAIIREYAREAGFDGEESMLSEPESQLLWEKALESVWFDELPENVQSALDLLLERESRDSVFGLLHKIKDLEAFGALSGMAESADPAMRALELAGRYVLEKYDRLKRRRGALDFADLEKGADRALAHPTIRKAYQKRFDLVLVDEFQDTNPVQASIIRRFCREDASNLCVVGDPKQSIYRFRDADVSVFEDFCSRLPARKSLTWNFRSRPEIIDFANRLCGEAFPASEMLYEPLVPKREKAADLQSVTRVDVTSPTELGTWIRQQVDSGVALHDMALLLRKIRGNEKWLKALTAAGIPIAVGSGGLFWEDPRVRELVAFLKWWDNPANALSGGVFFRAPWVGISDRVLDQWIKQDPTWSKPFFESQDARAMKFARVLSTYREKIARPGELLMALLVDSEVEDEIGSALLGLWHRVEELTSRGLDFHSVVVELGSAVQESRRERDVPPPRNQGQLSVLTLHGAKGLEFPHVILVDLGSKPRAPDSPLLFWDRKRGVFLGKRDASGERDKKDPVEISWREEEKKKNLAESKRVFYVALTRARERLVLVCPDQPDWDRETAFTEDYWRAWVECHTEGLHRETVASATAEVARVQPGQQTKTSDQVSWTIGSVELAAKNIRPRHSVTEWNLLNRCPRAYEWTYIRPLPMTEAIEEIGLFTGTKVPSFAEEEISQRELGTRVHACLEKGDYDGLRALEEEAGVSRFSAEPVISWSMSSTWMAPSPNVYTELAFEVPLHGEALVGSIDRVVQEGEKTILIDFKVTEKSKSPETLLESYQTQMELYASALRSLDPSISNLEAYLVNISNSGVQTIPVPLRGNEISVATRKLATTASEIVNGKSGEPKPGLLCRVCEFKTRCDAKQPSV